MRELGAVYGPYTGICFASTKETDIEHIVAASEAHEFRVVRSGRRDPGQIRARSSQPHVGLTPGEPPRERAERTPRSGPRTGTAAGSQHGCSMSAWPTTSPSIDARLRRSTESSLGAGARRSSRWCARSRHQRVFPASSPAGGDDPLALYDDNRNGKITCKEAASPRHRPGAAFAPGLSVYARRGRGWRRVRVNVPRGARPVLV